MTLESDLRDLTRVPMFAILEREALRLLAFSAESRTFAPGEKIFESGEASDCGYFLLDGAVDLMEPDREFPAHVAQAPALIGELALITSTERSTTAIASTYATTLRVSRALFQRVLKEHPRSARDLHAFVEGRLMEFATDLRVAGTAFSPPEGV